MLTDVRVHLTVLWGCKSDKCSFTHLVYAPCVPATRGMCKSVFQLFLVYTSKLERHRLGKPIRSSALPAEAPFRFRLLPPVDSRKKMSVWGFTRSWIEEFMFWSFLFFFFFVINIYIIVRPTGCASFFKPFLVYIEVRFQMGEMDHSFEKSMHCKRRWVRETCLPWLKVQNF